MNISIKKVYPNNITKSVGIDAYLGQVMDVINSLYLTNGPKPDCLSGGFWDETGDKGKDKFKAVFYQKITDLFNETYSIK